MVGYGIRGDSKATAMVEIMAETPHVESRSVLEYVYWLTPRGLDSFSPWKLSMISLHL
jgi:hypothetical protein